MSHVHLSPFFQESHSNTTEQPHTHMRYRRSRTAHGHMTLESSRWNSLECNELFDRRRCNRNAAVPSGAPSVSRTESHSRSGAHVTRSRNRKEQKTTAAVCTSVQSVTHPHLLRHSVVCMNYELCGRNMHLFNCQTSATRSDWVGSAQFTEIVRKGFHTFARFFAAVKINNNFHS